MVAPNITLDGDTTVTKSLTIQGPTKAMKVIDVDDVVLKLHTEIKQLGDIYLFRKTRVYRSRSVQDVDQHRLPNGYTSRFLCSWSER